MTELVILTQDLLKLHPRNIRLYYPPKAVEEMAASLGAIGKTHSTGNIQALLVVGIPDSPGHYWVVDGNLRLMAGRFLGPVCPPFKCEIIEASQAEQLLMMAASGLHFPKDIISQGRHYQRLIDEEGFSRVEIAQQTGLNEATISKCLAALELDEAIQNLFIEKKLSDDIRIIRGLKRIPTSEARVKIAEYYAGRDVAIGTIVSRLNLLATKANHLNGNGTAYQQARQENMVLTCRRQAAKEEKRRERIVSLDRESALKIAVSAQKILCPDCNLADISERCSLCPGPIEFMAHLGELVEAALVEDPPMIAQLS